MNPIRTAMFRFGPVRQETGSKHVRQGDLLEAVNVRQTAKAGVYAKRKAFVRTAQTFVGGSLSGTPETVLPGQSGNSLMRDTGDQLWARSNSTNTWSLMGTHRRPWPEVTTVQSNLYTAPQPFSCVVGTTVWAFALKTNAYEFSIVDAATGVVIHPRVTVTATGVVHASAAYDGTNVWVFWVDNGANGTVRCHKFTVATPTVAPVATNYYTFGTVGAANLSTVALQQVQACYFSAIGKVAVVACGGSKVSTTYKRACVHSYLDPATGLAVSLGAEAAVANNLVAYSGTVGSHEVGALCILDGQDGSAATWQFALVSSMDGSTYPPSLFKIRVNKTTLSTWSFIQVASVGNPALDTYAFTCAGYVNNSADGQYLFLTRWDHTTSGLINPIGTNLYQVNSNDTSVTTNATLSNSFNLAWTASGFATSGGRWFAITGYDDFATSQPYIGSEANSVQRCFHVREFVAGANADASQFNIVGQVNVGNGPALWHRNSATFTVATGTPLPTCCPPLHAVNGILLNACAVVSGALGYVDLAILRTTVSKTYGNSVQAMGRGFSPGAIPVTWNGECPVHEVAPLLAPSYLAVAVAGTGTDFSIAAAVYAIYDNDGTVWRSSPFVFSATIGHGATLSIPSPPAWMSTTNMFTEIYLGNNGTPKLQASLPVGSNLQPFTWVTPTVAAMVNGEILYTTGNALSQTWPVPCQAMGVWGNRIFCAQKNVLWTSKELEPGFGPLFNEIQKSTWSDERNEITAIAPVDWNYLGIASTSQVAVISGQGPDGVGNGNYVIKTLPSYTGVAAGSQATQGAQGMYYQNPGTGRIMCVTPSLQVLEAAGGAYDYAGYSFTIAAWYESENQMVFFAPASKSSVCIDYQHPQDVAPFGQTYLNTFASGFTPAAACRDDSGLLVLSINGHVYRPSSSQWVDDNDSGTTDAYAMKLTTAELQLSDLQGAFNLKTLQVLFTMRGASTVRITTYPGYASATGYDGRTTSTWRALPAPANSGDSETLMTKPDHCMRVQSFRVSIDEYLGVTTQSFEFEGLGIEYSAPGRLLRPASGRVI